MRDYESRLFYIMLGNATSALLTEIERTDKRRMIPRHTVIGKLSDRGTDVSYVR